MDTEVQIRVPVAEVRAKTKTPLTEAKEYLNKAIALLPETGYHKTVQNDIVDHMIKKSLTALKDARKVQETFNEKE